MKNVIITGSCGLIGGALVKGLKKKFNVIEIDILNKYKNNYYKCNILDEADLVKNIKLIIKKYKKIDCIINATYPKDKGFTKSLEKMSYKEFGTNLNLNVGSFFLLIKNILPHFKKRNYGKIIGISSVYSSITPKFEIYEKTPINFPLVYAPIKSAQLMLVKYFSKYFSYKKINVSINSISPGGVYDNHPKKFFKNYKKFCKSKGMIKPVELVGITEFLLSDKSHSITGQDIQVDDGFSS